MLPPTSRHRQRTIVQQAGLVAVDSAPKTRPPPRIGLFGQMGPQRIPLHVPQNRQQMIVRLNRERLETALVQRACSRRAMRRVPTLRVGDRQPTHELRQVAIATRPKHEMPVIGHDAPSQNPHRQTPLGLGDHLFERLIVSCLSENTDTPHGSIQHMVGISPAGNSQSSWHGRKLPCPSRSVKNKDSRPLYSLNWANCLTYCRPPDRLGLTSATLIKHHS